MKRFNIWVDDVRSTPMGWHRANSVNVAKELLMANADQDTEVHISLDHDAGDYQQFGGDFIELVKWLEVLQHEYGADLTNWYFSIHTQNPVGADNIKSIILHNGWHLERSPQ